MARENSRGRHERRFGKAERLIDMVDDRRRWAIPSWAEWALEKPEIVRSMSAHKDCVIGDMAKAKLIDGTNVGEYFYANNSKEVWDFEEDFPCCAPPFESIFIEFERPSRLNSEGRIAPASMFPPRWGWMIRAQTREQALAEIPDKDERANSIRAAEARLTEMAPLVDMDAVREAARIGMDKANDTLPERERAFLIMLVGYKALVDGDGRPSIPAAVRWVYHCDLILGGIDPSGKDVLLHVATSHFGVEENGSLFYRPLFTIVGGSSGETRLTEMRESWSALLMPALFTLSLMNCKNTSIEEVNPETKLNRERRKAGLKPFLRYHTINIEPMKAVLKTEGGIESNGLKKALHICRGHFATYSPEKPLFGHFSGTVWKPSHVRGSAKQGVVISDYNVKAPTPGA